MSLVVFKYPFQFTEPDDERPWIDLPRDALVLDVQLQAGRFVLWALVSLDQEEHVRCFFRFVGTGQTVPVRPLVSYIATIQDGSLVWHVFKELLGDTPKDSLVAHALKNLKTGRRE